MMGTTIVSTTRNQLRVDMQENTHRKPQHATTYTKCVCGIFRKREAHGGVGLDDCVMERGVREASHGAAVAR